MKIFSTSLIVVMIMKMLLLMTMLISKKTKINREKTSPFECGFMPMSSPRKSFSTHFFLIATLFLIFDIEISLILPMMVTKMMNMEEWMISSSITIIILLMGLMHEWNNNMLEWTK
uniref:NADH dehydrogenase subunit 3 n=1 Tax=Kodaianella bicinctifrons TaxID=1201171 RepID=UPI002A8299E0|nr:NADH dehydrogenase subunit 3 [Kodaianella bicinctifrons]WOW98885.1 NADH dehydrogenase subunit 3 [Kodaianella bicinctifrons]